MRDFVPKGVLPLLSDHPLIAAVLGVIFILILVLGSLHVFRLFLRFLVVLADEVKHELLGIRLWLRRLKEALTTSKPDT
jgi:hypothetical protein